MTPLSWCTLRLAGVDVGRRLLAQRPQDLALARDALAQVVARQRMAPPRLGEAPHQHVVVGVEEQHLELVPLRAQRREHLARRRQELALARVDADRRLLGLARARRAARRSGS